MADFELVVVVDDDISLADFFEELADPRIRHFQLPEHPGLSAAVNYGLANARAPLIARLDSDDVCEPDRLGQQLAMFDRDPDLDVAGSQITLIDEDGVAFGRREYPLGHDEIAEAMQRYNCVAQPAVMFRRDRVLAEGAYRDVPMEDYDLWCRLVVSGARFATHPEALLRYRYHHHGMTRVNTRHTIRATIDIKRRHFGARLTLRARARIVAERLLLLVPQRAVTTLFRLTQFKPLTVPPPA
jgi:glycosyltransferase involved in cell wall biosynthesis